MSQKVYGDWINCLPALEFIALLDLHAENRRQPEPEAGYKAPYAAKEPFGTWVDHLTDEQPVENATVVWVTYPDGSLGGPNRADTFIWDGPEIVSYAVATGVRKVSK